MTSCGFLTAEGLSLRTPEGVALLEDVSLAVDRGAILAIAGPNGAGKTTLLNLLCGLVQPSGGCIELDGKKTADMSPAERARVIAVVGQQEMPDGRLLLRDYVALGQIPIRADHSRTGHAIELDRILDIAGLGTLQDKHMAVLSGGERQRAHIARALAQRPALLFLDEPTNHLDPDAKGRMLSLVANLGITVVMIVHDIVLIPAFATHVALMKSTRLTAFGPVRDVLTPERVLDTFGVDYLCFPHEGRMIPALDIRKTPPSAEKGTL
jgi:iron complex transport system ATP-binding protein